MNSLPIVVGGVPETLSASAEMRAIPETENGLGFQ